MGNTPLDIVEQVSKGKHNKDHQKLYTTKKKTISSKNNGPLGATIQQCTLKFATRRGIRLRHG